LDSETERKRKRKMEILKNTVEEAIAIANGVAEFDDRDQVTPYWKYSGRGMFGTTCFAVASGKVGALLRFIVALTSIMDEDLVMEMTFSTHVDALGLDKVYYFPGVDVTE
jgi:hypothetical protein